MDSDQQLGFFCTSCRSLPDMCTRPVRMIGQCSTITCHDSCSRLTSMLEWRWIRHAPT